MQTVEAGRRGQVVGCIGLRANVPRLVAVVGISYDQGMTELARVSEKGQVTIPKRLRERMGIAAGDVLEFHEEHGRLVASKSRQRGRFDHLFGILKLDVTTDELLDELRGPADPT